MACECFNNFFVVLIQYNISFTRRTSSESFVEFENIGFPPDTTNIFFKLVCEKRLHRTKNNLRANTVMMNPLMRLVNVKE